ncbi:MAG: hypothetical protein U1F70_10490 [Candidatus Competibacteraceae bacterium]
MNKDLLVEIFVPTTERQNWGAIGTGYPVAKDRILTARHVLCPPNRDWDKPIEIRWHHQPPEERRWIEIPDNDVLWAGDEHCDAAVFACVFPPDAQPWGTLSIESPRPVEWESEGFPAVGEQDDNTRVATAMRGHMHRMAKAAPFFALDLPVGADRDKLHEGASGSPVMSGWKLLGVIVECPPHFDAKRLWAVPTCRLLEMPGFCEAIGYTQQTAALDLLREQIILELSASKDAMEALEASMSIAGDDFATRQPRDWAERLVKVMLGLRLEPLIRMLHMVYGDLRKQRKLDAADTIAKVSNAILPVVFDRGVVRALQTRMFDSAIALVDLPVANYTVAEIVVAGAEGRQACFCKAGDGKKTPVAEYRLKKDPPTSGIDSVLAKWAEDIERDLANKFVDFEDEPFLDGGQRREIIADRLGLEAESQRTRYMAFRFRTDEDRTKARNVLIQLKQRYPALVLLDLSTEGSRIVQEHKLFQYFEEILKTALEEPKP